MVNPRHSRGSALLSFLVLVGGCVPGGPETSPLATGGSALAVDPDLAGRPDGLPRIPLMPLVPDRAGGGWPSLEVGDRVTVVEDERRTVVVKVATGELAGRVGRVMRGSLRAASSP
jgi:hypothetical protein